MAGDIRLWNAAVLCKEWQQANKGNTAGWCLKCVRWALDRTGLKLPMSWTDYQGNSAITCGETLAKNPAKWGWKLLGTSWGKVPLDRPTLLFFRGCGGKHGHIALYKPNTNQHHANFSSNMTQYWRSRVAYCFEPLP